MVHMSLKKLKHHLAGFDVVVKERTTTTTVTEGTWEFEHTKACFRVEIIPFVKALKDLFNLFDQYWIDELFKVQNVFHQMEQAVENIGKAFADDVVALHSIDPEMLNVDVKPLNPRLLNNRSAHFDYLKHTQDEAAILREIIEQGVKSSTRASGSQPSGNTKKDKIQQPPSRNVFPLTRITTTTEVPSRKSIAIDTDTPKPIVTLVYSRIPRISKSTDLVSKSKVVKIVPVNKKEPSKSWGSTVFNVLSSSLDECSSVIQTLKLLFANTPASFVIKKVGISHETSIARSSQQNGIVKRCNHTLIEAACTMLIYAKAPSFLWAEAVATACYTQNRSIVRLRHGKTPYELLHEKLHDLSFFHVFGALRYLTNDSENLGKLQPKADIGIFIGYAPTKKAFPIYNRCTRQIIKTIHVDFDELTAMSAQTYSNHDPKMVVFVVEKTIQDAEKIIQLVNLQHLYSLADAYRDLDPYVDLPALLVAVSVGALADLGSFPSLRLFDPRSGSAEGSSSLSASLSRRLFRVTVYLYVSRMILSDL
nr:retrovirus-related Pol polyprotein from transposon TNT 1-94 [Tanacetum cinerariifolium]